MCHFGGRTGSCAPTIRAQTRVLRKAIEPRYKPKLKATGGIDFAGSANDDFSAEPPPELMTVLNSDEVGKHAATLGEFTQEPNV